MERLQIRDGGGNVDMEQLAFGAGKIPAKKTTTALMMRINADNRFDGPLLFFAGKHMKRR